MAKFTISGADDFFDRIERKINSLVDPNGICKTLALVEFIPAIQDNFRLQGAPMPAGAPGRTRWQPLNEKTIKQRRKGKGAGTPQVLIDTEQLRRSMLDAKAIRCSFDGRILTISVGTNIIYAATHNFGDKKRGIPQRLFLSYDKATIEDANRILASFLVGG